MNAPLLPGRIEHWPLARLQPYTRNAKTHDADQVAKIAASRRCCRTLPAKDSHRESMRLDGLHEQAVTRPLPHHELVQLHCGAVQARVPVDPLPGSACLHA